MPFVVYLFALSAFALGLAEFVPIGSARHRPGLQVGVGQAGSAVTLYALGATFAAPVLSAVTAGWPRRRAVLAAMLAFAAGSLAAALAPTWRPCRRRVSSPAWDMACFSPSRPPPPRSWRET